MSITSSLEDLPLAERVAVTRYIVFDDTPPRFTLMRKEYSATLTSK